MQKHDYAAVFRDRNLAVILLLGFSSGLPIALVGSTLQAWMTVEGVDLATIGLVTLIGVPYTWKFLWAPTMDRYVPPFLGRRRGWLVVTQVAIVAGLVATIAAIIVLAGVFTKRDKRLRCHELTLKYTSEPGVPYRPPETMEVCEWK